VALGAVCACALAASLASRFPAFDLLLLAIVTVAAIFAGTPLAVAVSILAEIIGVLRADPAVRPPGSAHKMDSA